MKPWRYITLAATTLQELQQRLDTIFLQLEAAWNANVVVLAKTAAYTMRSSDDMVLVDATGGAVTIKLPPPASGTKRKYSVKKTDASANGVTLDGNGGNIDGAATVSTTTQYAGWTVLGDGTNYWIVP